MRSQVLFSSPDGHPGPFVRSVFVQRAASLGLSLEGSKSCLLRAFTPPCHRDFKRRAGKTKKHWVRRGCWRGFLPQLCSDVLTLCFWLEEELLCCAEGLWWQCWGSDACFSS